jgi:dihydroflavonol-4-reductase
MKAFVTGATGFVGSHLVEALLQRNIEVFALVRNLTKLKWLKGLDIRVLKGDLFSIPSLPGDLDVVFHLAAVTKASKAIDYYTVNYKGTASLFKSLWHQGLQPQIIQMSSLSASGPSIGSRPLREDEPPHPVSPYGHSKLLAEGEALSRKADFRVIILRPGAIFGPREKDLLTLLRLINRGILPKMFEGRIRVSLCYVKDVIRAVLLCLSAKMPSGEIFHIAAPDPPTAIELGQQAARLMGSKPRIVHIPRQVAGTAAWMMDWSSRITKKRISLNRNLFLEMKEINWVADIQKAAEQLGFRVNTPLEWALTETIKWYRDRGWL